MPRAARSTVLIALLSCSMIAHAQDPPRPADKPEAPGPVLPIEIKPLPPVAIPDDPPPHEGAFFDLPITIEPPDIIVVEFLEALPGRPISGQRLVRPDGTISLGFYGDVHVRGLTPLQAKVKIILHVRKHLNDATLGLIKEVMIAGEPLDAPGGVMPAVPGRNPFDLDLKPVPKNEAPPAPEVPAVPPPVLKKPEADPKPAGETKENRPPARISRGRRTSRTLPRRIKPTAIQDVPKPDGRNPFEDGRPQVPGAKPEGKGVEVEEVPMMNGEVQLIFVDPADSERVFVDISSYNTTTYFVEGDVAKPGRVAFTGRDTVLDALNYAGGFVTTAEPTDIHLYRPARGGKPTKDYKIDLAAILKGDAGKNLQIFPNDRICVGRNPIVAKNIEVDRAAALVNTFMNSAMQYSFAARSLGVMNSPPSGGSDPVRVKVNGQNMPINVAEPTGLTPARRDAMLKEWAAFLWSISEKDGGAMLDEKAFREALMQKLTPAPDPK